MLTIEEIEALIKKKKVKSSSMPSFIFSLLVDEVDDGDAFLSGKEEGIAETNEEWENKDPETINPEYRIKYAIECLKDAVRIGDIDQKIRELEFELCRFL